LPSSASRDQPSMKPISFNLSSDREEKKDEAEQDKSTAAMTKASASIDSDPATSKSSPVSTSSQLLPQSDDDIGEEPQSPTMGSKRLLMS
jgi:hypothetical protein